MSSCLLSGYFALNVAESQKPTAQAARSVRTVKVAPNQKLGSRNSLLDWENVKPPERRSCRCQNRNHEENEGAE